MTEPDVKMPPLGSFSRRTFLGAAGGIAAMGLAGTAPAFLRRRSPSEIIRIGFVGTGSRGHDHLWALGYFDPDGDRLKRKRFDPQKRLKGVDVVALCDAFDDNLDSATRAVAAHGPAPARYLDYREMFEKEDLDAVFIATPDHLHTPAALAAFEAGLDVYLEKCASTTLEDIKLLRDGVREHERVLQMGHQTRQDQIHKVAREIVQRGELGQIHMVQCYLNRGGPTAGWVRKIAENGGPERSKVHWKEFLGPAPDRPYDVRRFFEWRRYWDYSTGISGDLFSHALDAMSIVLGLGIPQSVVSSGGIYHWRDGRETPDVYTTVLEYPERGLSFTFEAILANGRQRPTVIMGTDATMELNWEAKVFPDPTSPKFKDDIKQGKVKLNRPYIHITDKAGALNVKTAPSDLWLQGSGLTLTEVDGKVRDTTRLHHEDFYRCMKSRKDPVAGIGSAFDVTVGCHMGTESYRTGRRVNWDAKNEKFT